MAKKVRRDPKGRILQKGETYKKDRKLYCFSYTDPFGNRSNFYAKDLPQLRDKEKALLKDRMDGLDLYTRGRADINFVFDRYISTKNELRSTTMTNYVYTYDHFVRSGFGKKKIAEVKYSDVLLFYNKLLEQGIKVNTLDSVHTVLHPTFQLAVRDKIITNNPSDGVMAEIKKKDGKNKGIRHALEIDEARAFLNYLDKPGNIRWKPLFVVLFGTGCRIGEVIGLRWEDIDLDNRMITINHSVTYYPRIENSYKCEFEVSLPKTEAGIRTIPMLDEVYDAFIQEKELQEYTGEHCTMEVGGMKDFIFCNRFNNLHNPQGINRAIKRIVNDHNQEEIIKAKREKREPLIIPKFSCHITRHSFCSRLCENDTNVKVIQSVMGHKDIQTTLDIYAEVSDKKKKDVFDELNRRNIF